MTDISIEDAEKAVDLARERGRQEVLAAIRELSENDEARVAWLHEHMLGELSGTKTIFRNLAADPSWLP